MPKVWVMQHVACETLGAISDVLDGAGVAYEYVRTHEGQPVPADMSGADGLILMGGPMGVYEQERYPHLAQELRLIEQALAQEKPVLGVCLGSQLLAAALGAPVRPGPQKEIGWYTISLSDSASTDPLLRGMPSPFTAFVWHGDVFDLPDGAVSLASSALTVHQAFRYERNAYGILFHMEVTEGLIGGMVETFANELREEGIAPSSILAAAHLHLPALRHTASEVFGRWASLLRE